MADGDNVFCTECGASCSSDDKFCSQCGARLHKEITCPKCGNSCVPDAKFCSNCGTRLAQSEPSSNTEQAKSEPSSNTEQAKSEPSPYSDLLSRVILLKKEVDDMIAHLKYYSFQEFEAIMLNSLNRDQCYPSLQELDEIIKSMAGAINDQHQDNDKTLALPSVTQRQIEDVLTQQREVVKYLNQFTSSALPTILSTCEAQKISCKDTPNWLSLKQKYEEICDQLKDLDEFKAEDIFDFTQLFNGSLSSACDNASLTAKRIMLEVGNDLQDVCTNSARQISLLGKLNERLFFIKQRLV